MIKSTNGCALFVLFAVEKNGKTPLFFTLHGKIDKIYTKEGDGRWNLELNIFVRMN